LFFRTENFALNGLGRKFSDDIRTECGKSLFYLEYSSENGRFRWQKRNLNIKVESRYSTFAAAHWQIVVASFNRWHFSANS